MAPDTMKLAVLALTRHGVSLAMHIRDRFPRAVCHVPARHRFAVAMGAVGFDRIGEALSGIWREVDGLVCVMATGIVVRHVAPLLEHKATDPAVVVLDEKGHYVISLLSGHLGGANALAREVAAITGGQAVITTASDVRERPSLDLIAREKGLQVENLEVLSRVAGSILDDESFWVFDPYGIISRELEGLNGAVFLPEAPRSLRDVELFLSRHQAGRQNLDSPESPPDQSPPDLAGVWASEKNPPGDLLCVILRPRNLVVGVGCNRGTPAGEIWGLMESVFGREGLSVLSIRNLASIDIKCDEKGLLEVAERLEKPLNFYSSGELAAVQVPNPSDTVAKYVGAQSVCEATALLSANTRNLLVTKEKTKNVTLAVARAACP